MLFWKIICLPKKKVFDFEAIQHLLLRGLIVKRESLSAVVNPLTFSVQKKKSCLRRNKQYSNVFISSDRSREERVQENNFRKILDSLKAAEVSNLEMHGAHIVSKSDVQDRSRQSDSNSHERDRSQHNDANSDVRDRSRQKDANRDSHT
jgi:hypothetical protein